MKKTIAAFSWLLAAASFAADLREGCHSWVDINTNLFAENVRALRKIIGSETKICAVMKADAYGCGIRTLMPEVINTGVECVGVAGNDDALAVRASGYTGRVARVRMATLGEVDAALGLEVEELVGSLEFAREADRVAARANRRLRFHLCLNAGGMDRNGLDMTMPGSLEEAVAICRLPNLEVVAIMTHYPVEDVADVRPGLRRFNSQAAAIIAAAHLDRSKLTLHTANSFVTLHVPEARLDMCRPGSIFYMDYDSEFPCFKTIFSFKTRVAAVHSYPKGSTACYDRTYTLKRDSRLANLPVGYADGYLRCFGNKGRVLVRGHSAPIVGVISMNTCLADVTDFPDVVAEDEVVLFGAQGKEEITAKEVEDVSGMPIYAIFLLWGKLNPQFPFDSRDAVLVH